jgi:hypothetical protein
VVAFDVGVWSSPPAGLKSISLTSRDGYSQLFCSKPSESLNATKRSAGDRDESAGRAKEMAPTDVVQSVPLSGSDVVARGHNENESG